MTTKDKKIIEDSEARNIPIFVFTAKDDISLSVLRYYRLQCRRFKCPVSHVAEINSRIDEFKTWMDNNPEKVKLPD